VERRTGLALNLRVPYAALAGREFQALRRVHQKMKEMVGQPPFTLHLGQRKADAISYEDLRTQIVELAKEGIQLQRFKGLGEMNPDQLWETTMNPMSRTLQLVGMEDAMAAEEVFTMLMGDKVEPRREFIEKNAREVRFLDV
jgi:DNA gyrase subunit B